MINAMDTPTAQREVDVFLTQLGQRHQSMGIEKQFLDAMGPIFCNSIRDILLPKEEWNQEV